MTFGAASVRTDSSSNVAVVEPTQDWRTCNLSPRFPCWPEATFCKAFRDLLPDAWMRSGAVVRVEVFLHDAIQLATILDKHMIQALPPQAANEALTI